MEAVNKRAKDIQYPEGCKIYKQIPGTLKDAKLQPRYTDPYRRVAYESPVLELEDQDGTHFLINQNKAKKAEKHNLTLSEDPFDTNNKQKQATEFEP